MPIAPGTIVGDRFEIQRVADSGGMGMVYRARDRRGGGEVALKVLLDCDSAPADRFAHEVELLSTLDHPHIVGYVSHGTTEDGAPFLVMPWLEGIDLDRRLKEGPLSIDDTITLARRVAEALAYLHGRGLVHRDLKPSNLFLPGGKVDDVKVIDLGVARPSLAARALTLSGTLIGTPGFIAPEQARGDHVIAPAVDVFALGCVLFECLTGRRLFSGAHLMSVLAKILIEDAPRVRELRPDVPVELDRLVQKMVSKEPEKRPRDGAQLAEWLQGLDKSSVHDSGRPSGSHAIGAREQRVASVLVVLLPAGARGSVAPMGDATRLEADPFRAAAARFGVRAQLLAERMAVVLAPERVSAPDQAVVLARFARHVVETFPGASVALTTGSALTGSVLPAGEAIDRAVTMVRSTTAEQGVVIDDVTAALITSRFDVRREAGRISVVAERLSLDPTRPLLGRPTSCVGRDRELTILESAAAECAAGEGPKVVLVTAPAGAGKSRVRHELVRRLAASDDPPSVRQCQGDPLHTATPYAMLAQCVRHAAGVREREPIAATRERLRRHVEGLVGAEDAVRVTHFLGELVGVTFDDEAHLPMRAARLDAGAMADQIGRAFEDLMRAWCARQSLVLVLEDLHWADAASVKLIERALRKLEGARLFVVAMARPEVHERFPALFAKRDVTEIHLPPLARRACAKLVQEVIGEALAVDVDRIIDASEGNGFYLEELIRAAAERAKNGTPAPSSSRRDDFPATVLAVAHARLERLDPDARKLLRAASVFGDVFWLEGVAALLGEPVASLAPRAATLIDQEAVAPAEQPRLAGVTELAFRHALLRGAAYATLTPEDRALGHRIAAQWLEETGEDREVVALHWLDAHDRAKAAESFTQAGYERWFRAHADAAGRCALRALLVADPAERDELSEERVRLLSQSLEATRSLDRCDVLQGLEHAAPESAHMAANAAALVSLGVERALASIRDRRRSGMARALGACALGALSDLTGAKRLLADARASAGDDVQQDRWIRYASVKVAFWSGEGSTAVDALADTLLPDDAALRREMLLILAWAVVLLDGHDALARGLDFVSRAELLGAPRGGEELDPVARVHCAKARFFCFYHAGEYAAAAETADAAVAIARSAGLRFDECAHLHNAGEQYIRLGERDRARALIQTSNEIARDIGAERSERYNAVLLAFLDAQVDALARIATEAPAAGDAWLELYARYWLAQLLASTRDPSARAALEHALGLARDLKVRTMAEDCARAIAALPVPSTSV